jgi:membrane-associated phospholipid phosphatase
MKRDTKRDRDHRYERPERRDPARTEEGRPRRRQRFLPLAIGMSGGVALASIAFWFFKEQAEHVVAGRADRYDTMVLDLVHSTEQPAFGQFMKGATYLGTHAGIGTVAGLTAVALWRQHRSSDAWTVVLSTGGAMALNTILKNIFQRRRPQELARKIALPRSHSFPSGHSLLSAATFPIVAHHLVENQSSAVQILGHGAAFAMILSVGYSRIYFGVHFPSDVLGGFAAGLGWLGLTSLAHTIADDSRRERRRRSRA